MKTFFKNIFFILVLTISLSIDKLNGQTPEESVAAAERYGWRFHNFGTNEITWDVYCHALYGIPQDKVLATPFDIGIFELLKNKVAEPGNCSGLSSLSLMMDKYGGYLGYCAPASFQDGATHLVPTVTNPLTQVPIDSLLVRTINIMQVRYTMNNTMIQSFIDQTLPFNVSRQINLAKETLAREGAFCVSMQKNVNISDGGHTIIGYNVTQVGSTTKIWIVDCNRESVQSIIHDYYEACKNFIEITGSSWRFQMANGDYYPLSSGGFFEIFSLSQVGIPSPSLSSLGLSITNLIDQICIFGEYNNTSKINKLGPTNYNSKYISILPMLPLINSNYAINEWYKKKEPVDDKVLQLNLK